MAVHRMIQVALLILFATGCSKEALLRSSLEDAEERKDTLQLTLKIFDEHPEYVDELFEIAKGHDLTFDRLIQQAALAAEDPAFAAKVALKLAKHPKGVELITRAMLVEARTNPELRAAMAAALLTEGDVVNQIVSEHPQLMQKVLMRTIGGGTPAPAPVPPTTPPAEM